MSIKNYKICEKCINQYNVTVLLYRDNSYMLNTNFYDKFRADVNDTFICYLKNYGNNHKVFIENGINSEYDETLDKVGMIMFTIFLYPGLFSILVNMFIFICLYAAIS